MEVMAVVSVENVCVSQVGLAVPVTVSTLQSNVWRRTSVSLVVDMAHAHVAHVHVRMVGQDATVITVLHVWTHVTNSNSV